MDTDETVKIRVDIAGYEPVPRVLLSEKQIQERIEALGKELAEQYAPLGGVHVITVLQGAMHFSSDLQRAMQQAAPQMPMVMDTIRVQSYAGTTSTGEVRSLSELHTDVSGKHVLVVEDIYDTGKTLSWICEYIRVLKPATLAVATLLDKKVPNRPSDLLGDTELHVGFEVPNDFVIGYGLDYEQLYRNLRDIYWLKKQG